MPTEDEHFEFMISIKDKKISKLLNGIYQFFDSKFPTENFDTNPHVNEDGYHMNYLGVEYNFNFIQGENMKFEFKAKLPKVNDKLEERLEKSRISNSKLNRSKYLADQHISSNGTSVEIYCRLKKIPKSDSDVKKLCHQIWGDVIQRAMYGITQS